MKYVVLDILENILREEQSDIKKSIENFKNSQKKHLLIIVQTTFSLNKFINLVNTIKDNLKNTDKNIEVINTICNATKLRQEETEQISKKVEYMIIIGGKNSSNTKKLYEIAKANCVQAICVEDYKELNFNDLKNKNTIGIMAGASTPQKSIDEVVEFLNSNNR